MATGEFEGLLVFCGEGGDIDLFNGDGEVELSGEIFDKELVLVGVGAAELVVEVEDVAGVFGLMEEVEKGDGVGAAGYGDIERLCGSDAGGGERSFDGGL
jgi:hypothetical protein